MAKGGRIVVPRAGQVRRAEAKLADLYQERADIADELEERRGQLSAARETSGELDRPPWAAGHSNREVKAFAARQGLNPYKTGWWETPDAEDVQEFKAGAYRARSGGAERGISAMQADVASLRRQAESVDRQVAETEGDFGTTLPHSLSRDDIRSTRMGQSPIGQALDSRRTNKYTAPVTSTTENELRTQARWLSSPRRADILSVDAPRIDRPRKVRL